MALNGYCAQRRVRVRVGVYANLMSWMNRQDDASIAQAGRMDATISRICLASVRLSGLTVVKIDYMACVFSRYNEPI